MSTERKEISGEELNDVVGGALLYTWDGFEKIGTCGLDGAYNYVYTDVDAFDQYIADHQGQGGKAKIAGLLAAGIISPRA